ncbi:MAG: flagellar export protein FliJ [Candidatus Thiodiazotropha taylori]|uniref:Flagellar FliJ protein n=1 Tax=Candidatus Thiodiazotropha taylori TaxID=2792791 RepID=A0A9E4P1N8_9GAMM|nr:flagellar export protein FliJ [Candidatus Thiodiazotropha taylori]MCG8016412.1 flagellar export protein FliJ [Candidatus Thiodiazotropha sp. 'RUGA']RLW54782.1 MAG: flagellar export protein FliJ [gamma proteobacterium symbiont of Stewartia floridana]MCG7954018.1 flagellar export protein FliJ [Candidatus Thiodiazotropha taylori]MCG7967036.1 flagellar export protein FliJ [Candidatus Thiodiazotropha taylori]
MSPSKRLKPVQRFAHSKEQNAARSMGQARKNLEQEEAKLKQLKQYHQEYLERFEQMAREGMTSTQLQEYRTFLAKLDEAINQQQQVVAASMVNHNSQKTDWKQKHSRTQALNKVIDRYREKEQKSADRREQKESDEHNQRNR